MSLRIQQYNLFDKNKTPKREYIIPVKKNAAQIPLPILLIKSGKNKN